MNRFSGCFQLDGDFLMHHFSEDEKYFSCYQVARGCVETLSLGLLFLIPDLIATINRQLEETVQDGSWFCNNFGLFLSDSRTLGINVR